MVCVFFFLWGLEVVNGKANLGGPRSSCTSESSTLTNVQHWYLFYLLLKNEGPSQTQQHLNSEHTNNSISLSVVSDIWTKPQF